MSNSKDSNQNGEKFKHIGENVFQIGLKEKTPAKPMMSSRVIKAGDLKSSLLPQSVQIGKYPASELAGKKATTRPVETPLDLSKTTASALALESMKQNLKSLNDLQSRLRFVLKELEELVQE